MKTDLYQRCPVCDGTCRLAGPAMVDDLAGYTGPLAAGSACPCIHSSTPGWAKIGLTVGQVERIIEDRDRLLAACKMVLDDPGLTASANDVIRAAIAAAEGGAK